MLIMNSEDEHEWDRKLKRDRRRGDIALLIIAGVAAVGIFVVVLTIIGLVTLISYIQ